MGWLARSLGEFGQNIGEAQDIVQARRQQQQQMALEQARQKIEEMRLPLELQDLQQRVRHQNRPQPEGTIAVGDKLYTLTFNPETGAYEKQELGPALPKITVQSKGEPIPGEAIGREKGTFWYPQTDVSGQVVGYMQTGAPKATRPTAFEEWQSNPKLYEQFQKNLAAAKQLASKNAGFMSVYAIYRMMDMAYKDNPNLLPFIQSVAPQVFQKAGMNVPPEIASVIGQTPTGQPLSPETGAPIGLSMPGAPVQATRSQAQTAARVQAELPRIRKEIQDLAEYLGPVNGRVNVAFLLGKVGSTGDPNTDRVLSKLKVDLKFLTSASARFHLNSVRAFEDFETTANAGKDSSNVLLGALDSISEWANTAQAQERGFGETGGGNTDGGGDINMQIINAIKDLGK